VCEREREKERERKGERARECVRERAREREREKARERRKRERERERERKIQREREREKRRERERERERVEEAFASVYVRHAWEACMRVYPSILFPHPWQRVAQVDFVGNRHLLIFGGFHRIFKTWPTGQARFRGPHRNPYSCGHISRADFAAACPLYFDTISTMCDVQSPQQ